MRTLIALFYAVCLVGAGQFAAASDQTKTIVLGGKNGWDGALSYGKDIGRGEGRFGYESLELAANARRITEFTDLLIDFEDGRMIDAAGNYTVTASHALPTLRAVMGKGAAVMQGAGGVSLKGAPSALFGSQGAAGSFTIEFWLKPAIAENGEMIFSWRSSRTVNNYPVYQMIIASIFNNRLEWKFTNVFAGYTGADGEITLTSGRIIIPDKWAHHSVSFDEETGLFEYRIDNSLEDIRYVTGTGRERGEVFQPVLGVAASIEFCPNFSGSIDDIRIVRSPREKMTETQYAAKPAGGHYDVYHPDGGRFETQPITADTPGATLAGFSAMLSQPSQTGVQFFVRADDYLFGWTDDSPAWIPVEPGKPVPPVRGRYFQAAANLYPDGAGSITPSVTEITLAIRQNDPPLQPFLVQAQAGDRSVTLTWSISIDDTAGGYYVFYGERPGEYLGAAAVEGRSPIDAGKKTTAKITGLTNCKVYYFAIASYSDYDNSITGEFSKEVHARPLISSGIAGF